MAKEMVCVRCGTVGKPKKSTKGSFAVEVVMWLLLIIPGIIYSMWRMTAGKMIVCRSCGSEELVPVNSPRGQQLLSGGS